MSVLFDAAEMSGIAGGIRRAAVVNFGGSKKSVRKLHLWECASREVVILEQIGRSFVSLVKKSGGFRNMLRFYRDKSYGINLMESPLV